MLKKFRLPMLALAAALALTPTAAFAREHHRDHHVRVYVGPAYPYGYYGYYGHHYRGWYDRWGYWHPY